MADISIVKNSFKRAVTGTDVKNGLINLVSAVNDGLNAGESDTTTVLDGFANNEKLLNSTLVHAMQTIGSHAFTYCSTIRHVRFNNVKSIGDSAFGSCLNLEIAEFPYVQSIGPEAFALCPKLNTLLLVPDRSMSTAYSSVIDLTADIFGLPPSSQVVIVLPYDLEQEYINHSIWGVYYSDPTWSNIRFVFITRN